MTVRKSVILSLFAGISLFVLVMALLLNKLIYDSNVESEVRHLESTMKQIIHAMEIHEAREKEAYEKLGQEYAGRAGAGVILESIPTERHRILFALDHETGEVLALSKNNEPQKPFSHEKIRDMEESETRTGVFRAETGDKIWSATFVRRQGIIYGYASDLSALLSGSRESFVFGLSVILVVSGFILFLVYWILGRLVIHDLERINQKLALFVNGGSMVCFDEGKNREIKKLSGGLNKLVSVMESKRNHLCSLADMFDESVAAYEYYAELNQIFFSDNLLSLTELSEEEICTKIRSEYETAKQQWSGRENGFYKEERYETKSGRTLMIHQTCMQNISYAFVQDVTKAAKTIQKLNKKLEEEMSKNTRDSLTGLFNRNKVEEEAREMFQEEKPQGMLVLIDLDNFKRVNDEAGHMEGDKVLKMFGQVLDRQFRATDTKARLGGDEFVVLLQQELTTEVLQQKLNRFLDEVRTELEEYYGRYRLSVSIGVAPVTGEIHSFAELYKSADAAMYVAKRSGKDRFYVNKENNTCMRENCIHCRAICERRRILFEKKEV